MNSEEDLALRKQSLDLKEKWERIYRHSLPNANMLVGKYRTGDANKHWKWQRERDRLRALCKEIEDKRRDIFDKLQADGHSVQELIDHGLL